MYSIERHVSFVSGGIGDQANASRTEHRHNRRSHFYRSDARRGILRSFTTTGDIGFLDRHRSARVILPIETRKINNRDAPVSVIAGISYFFHAELAELREKRMPMK